MNKITYTLTIILIALSVSINLRAQEINSTVNNQDEIEFKSKFTVEELANAPVKLIPYPEKVSWGKEELPIIDLKIKKSKAITPSLHKEIVQICSENQIQINSDSDYLMTFTSDENLPEEGYTLKVNKSELIITASTETGYYYALQTFRQLINRKKNSTLIHLCQIEDKPKFPIRGFMIDVGRNFQSIEMLKKQLDIMAKYKLNTFHWHLTDRPAWRIESKKYPELIAAENHRTSRNPGQYYTYDEIRDFIKYANERQINVIPEIDMPGHSDSFIKSMGCRMESAEGMEILENVLMEFFSEIPKELAPIIHIGSDEVHIPNPKEFISKMVNIIERNGREVVVWSPGLKAKKSVIKQTWGDDKDFQEGYREIDSKFSYINNGEPMSFINRLFFKPIGENSNNEILGGIICLWPDVNVWSEKDIYRQNPVYPALLTYAWLTWTADVISSPKTYQTNLPLSNTIAAEYFSVFEQYIIDHKERYFSDLPFPYYVQSDKHWQLIGPFDKNEGDSIVIHNKTPIVNYKGEELKWKEAIGNTLTINARASHFGHYPEAKEGQSVYARTYIHSEQDTSVQVWINFETPLRANRAYTGIANNGSWDINGGKLWINDQLLEGPSWKNPGWKPFKQNGWAFGIDSEIPWTDEELYWLRKPGNIQLNKGWNKIYVKIPASSNYQNWMFTFVPLNMNGIIFSTKPIENETKPK